MNTRKLIEGLYRQKFKIRQEVERIEEKLEKMPKTKDNVDVHKGLSARSYNLAGQEVMIDELLIDFFGE